MVTIVRPNLLLEGTDESSEQRVDESQETDVSHMPMLQENLVEDFMFMDPKVRAQAEWYHRTGEVLPTLQAVMGHGDAVLLPIDAASDEPSQYTHEGIFQLMWYVAPLIAQYMLYITAHTSDSTMV